MVRKDKVAIGEIVETTRTCGIAGEIVDIIQADPFAGSNLLPVTATETPAEFAFPLIVVPAPTGVSRRSSLPSGTGVPPNCCPLGTNPAHAVLPPVKL